MQLPPSRQVVPFLPARQGLGRGGAELPAIGGSVPAVSEEHEKPKPLLEDWRVRSVAITAAVIGFLIGLVVFGAPWHLSPAWGDIPSWISAIVTIGLLIGAVVTARYAIKAFRKQSVEVAIRLG